MCGGKNNSPPPAPPAPPPAPPAPAVPMAPAEDSPTSDSAKLKKQKGRSSLRIDKTSTSDTSGGNTGGLNIPS